MSSSTTATRPPTPSSLLLARLALSPALDFNVRESGMPRAMLLHAQVWIRCMSPPSNPTDQIPRCQTHCRQPGLVEARRADAGQPRHFPVHLAPLPRRTCPPRPMRPQTVWSRANTFGRILVPGRARRGRATRSGSPPSRPTARSRRGPCACTRIRTPRPSWTPSDAPSSSRSGRRTLTTFPYGSGACHCWRLPSHPAHF